MKRVLIATHGGLASGFKSSLALLVGGVQNITAIDAYSDNVDLELEINQYFAGYDPNEELYIFTDLSGGSVNQKILAKFGSDCSKCRIITGINLSVMLEILTRTTEISDSELETIISKSRKELNISRLPVKQVLESNEDFLS